MPRTTRRSVKQRLQYIQVIQELQEEIKLLQISNEKLNGEGLDGLSYTELASLETMLKEGFRIVEEQTDKAQQEQLLREIVDCDVMGKEWLDEKEKEDLAYQSLLARRRTAMRNKARELRLSPQDSQKEHSYNHETLMLTIECLKIEKERLRLLNQRMIGKELDGMVYLELLVFSCAIHSGITTRRSVKQRLQYIQVIQELQEEIKLLQISNEKLNGEGLDGLSYTELASLETMLKEGFRIVEEQTDKAQQELLLREIVDCDVMGKEWLDEKEKEDLAYQSLLARRRTAMRNKARELRLSPQDSQKEHSYNHETLMLTIECLKIEKERLRVLNQRMIGKEVDGMGYSELLVFSCAIQSGMLKAEEEKKKIKPHFWEESVVIVGAGIGGLATALSLHRLGVRSVVLEQAKSLRTGGTSLTLFKNGWRVLDAISVGPQLRTQFLEIEGMVVKNGDGRELRSFAFKDEDQSQEVRAVERRVLLETLASQLPPETIKFSSKLKTIQSNANGDTQLELEDGSKLLAKIVIACDGIRSKRLEWVSVNQNTSVIAPSEALAAIQKDSHFRKIPTSAPPSSRRGSCGFGSGEARNVKRGGKLVWVDIYRVEMAIADDTAEGTFVWFDGVMTKLHNLRASEAVQMLAEDGVNPEDSRIPPFIADMEGKSYTFQVRVTAYNFTSNHKTLIFSIVDELGRVRDDDVDDNGGNEDDDDNMPNGKPAPVGFASGRATGNGSDGSIRYCA
ncbi:LOW QUALITY PROTEIN: hypothetical protein HID58_062953 [Brassica napus]|uniref:FAD-binding domain-containing protein n=1 Tax=Brassica napus TaxID=3708 RepID=A0ABQ8A2X9_BRANA|nr:LOW QUALITY PROTEIN: hypothetical protein HID58_062953 [Brassica napus]